MPRYKRNAAEAELDVSILEDTTKSEQPVSDTLKKIRNMWEFASLMQYIYLFGSVVKIDEDLDIEDLEHECLQDPPTDTLPAVGLALLKYVSSHRGLTQSIFTEYTRRQYLAKLPSQNPFGEDDEPTPFNDLDIYTRIQVLQQLSTWTFGNAERIRGLMPEDEDHLTWRIEPLGWDAKDRSYFVLDDNRLYRRTDEPLAPPTPEPKTKPTPASKKKKKAAPKTRGTRTSKRRRVEELSEDEEEVIEAAENTIVPLSDTMTETNEGYGFTSNTWECIAITLEEYQHFLLSIQKSRDPNEKLLRRRIEEEVLPIIEKRAEALRQKQLRKLRELENLQKLATAKRSSRLADKADKHAKEEEERQVELKKAADLRMARDEQARQKRIEDGHESRRLTREQRLKEREVKRILHEEELARLEREASTTASQQGGTDAEIAERKRLSSRNLQNQQEAHRKELQRLTQDQEEDKWYFDCVVCGMHGENLDDGSHSVACERCNVWQHSHCHGFTPEQCEDADFHFVCKSCRAKDKAAKEQKSGIVLKLGKQVISSSPQASRSEINNNITVASVKKENPLPEFVRRQLDGFSTERQLPPAPHLPPQQQHQQIYPQGQQPSYRQAYIPQHTQQAYQPQMQPQPPRPAVQYTQPPPFNRGFAGLPPQRTQQMPQPSGVMYQHNWLHNNAVNGTLPQLPTTQARPQPYIPPQTPAVPRALQSSPTTLPAYTPQHLQTPQPRQSPVVASGALPSSPHTSFPPPTNEYNRQAAISPLKSSPPRPGVSSPVPSLLNGHAPSSFAGTNTASPNPSFEHVPKLTTPSKASDVKMSPTQDVVDVATNGMKGPWPDTSLSVPHKHEVPTHHTQGSS